MLVPTWIVGRCHIQFPVPQPAWPWHSPRCHRGCRSPLTCWFSVQLNPGLAAVTIPVLKNNTSLVNTGLWEFVFGFFGFMDSLLLLHNKAQCILQGVATSVCSQPRFTSRVLRPRRAGRPLVAVKTSQPSHFSCHLLAPGHIWGCLAYLGIKHKVLSQICPVSLGPGLQGQR